MTDVFTTAEQDVAAIIAEIVNEVKTIETDAATVVRAVIAGIKQGSFALPLTQIAAVLKDAAAAEAALVKDVNAVVPQNVKDFLASTGTLDSIIAVPFTGKTLTSVHFVGTKDELVAKLAAGMPI